jgi:septum formation protein
MLILCSNSKVRAKLLQDAKIEFIQKSCEFDEDSITTQEPLLFVKEATEGKFRECLKCFDGDVLCADTIITDGKTLIRKPKDINEARELLLLQSGRKIDIITYHLLRYKQKTFTYLAKTTYYFKKFDENDLENYLKSGEWKGSAGGCKVEGFCKKYIKHQEGYQSTAMGLNVEWLIEILKENNEKC